MSQSIDETVAELKSTFIDRLRHPSAQKSSTSDPSCQPLQDFITITRKKLFAVFLILNNIPAAICTSLSLHMFCKQCMHKSNCLYVCMQCYRFSTNHCVYNKTTGALQSSDGFWRLLWHWILFRSLRDWIQMYTILLLVIRYKKAMCPFPSNLQLCTTLHAFV